MTAIPKAAGFERVALLKDAVEKILVNDESKKRYRNLANFAGRLYKAILPDEQAGEFAPVCGAIAMIARDDTLKPPEVGISGVVKKAEDLLDRSIAADGPGAYVIDSGRAERRIDLSQIDFEALPDAYTDEQYEQKCELAYHHVYESYFGPGKSIYSAA